MSGVRKLACEGCRKRRRRCDKKVPCSNCVKHKIECVMTNNDSRSNRTSVAYVQSLEKRVKDLEMHITQMRGTVDSGIDEVESVGSSNASDGSVENLNSGGSSTNIGIYPSNSLSLKRPRPPITQTSSQRQLLNLSKNPTILKGLSLFFKWLYPGHFMFIHRETFLNSFFGDFNTKSYYCSEELVYAIFALGAQIADRSDDVANMGAEYYRRSKSMVLTKIFQSNEDLNDESTSSSKLAIIQTLLCLAFYDIGHGDNPMAWYLSGSAFRISYEIGLHLNPEAWAHVYEDELSGVDIEVRSRVYWGCYIADHLITLLFGRTTILKLSNSTVPETDESPEIESGIEDFIFDPKCTLSMAKPLKNSIVVCRITEVFAPKIFGQSEFPMQRREHLSKFNLEMYNWRKDSPKELRWSRSTIKNMHDFNPSRAYIWFHYYLVSISYNKPFLEELKLSRESITEHIDELSLSLEGWEIKFGGFQTTNLYMVYCVILSLQCMKTETISNRHYKQFMAFLKSPSLTYEIAKKFVDNDNEPAGTEPSDLLLGTLSSGTDLKLEYNLDFTSLNEIDSLIGGSNGPML